MMRSFLISLPLLLAASSANASNWVKLGEGTNRVLYVDTESIRTVDGYKSAWTEYEHSTGASRLDKSLDLYDCAGARMASKAFVEYKVDGTTESLNFEDYELKWEPVVPDSLGETAYNAVCR